MGGCHVPAAPEYYSPIIRRRGPFRPKRGGVPHRRALLRPAQLPSEPSSLDSFFSSRILTLYPKVDLYFFPIAEPGKGSGCLCRLSVLSGTRAGANLSLRSGPGAGGYFRGANVHLRASEQALLKKRLESR